MERVNAWTTYNKKQKEELETLNKGYIDFLSTGKTERECVKEIVAQAKAAGYISLEKVVKQDIAPGTKIYAVCMDKTIALFNIGKKPLTDGMNILGAHIDSPRLDVKSYPLYDNSDLAYFDTHYYGGIKKYQWVTIPLAIHGVVAKKDGSIVDVNIGEKPEDPVFCISDLLIHLASKQMTKKATEVVEGENLDVIVGSIPVDDEEKNAVKKGVLDILKKQYQIDEEDFMSAELEVVPAGPAREAGFDKSMILAYGQDDRVCAYTSLVAMFEKTDVDRTACCLLADKEEIGSVGATGMRSKFFENTVAELLDAVGNEPYNEMDLKRTLANSMMLSSDVSAGYDPLYSENFDKRNSSFLGRGVVLKKYNGARGKSGSNDANAEYLGKLRKIFDDNKVNFQMGELGKIDRGGGGTIAYILSLYGMEVVDCGVPVLNMHAPWELASKADVYEAYKCYKAFLDAE
ncbi:MAG: aminopeptidase [Eubacterium sp.]|nr:aminopeptidase [Eubacterium sp.]